MQDVLEDLNREQEEAVRFMEKPLLVFAGPGTGKTKVVTHKLAHLIREKGHAPEEVVALTFSENAAREMKERVEELVPDRTGFRISTFHSFCYELIRDHSLDVGINSRGQIMADEHQQAFLLGNFDDIGIETFNITAHRIDLVKTLQGAMARFKQENISLEDLENHIEDYEGGPEDDDEGLGHLRDLARAYRLYEEFKERRGLLDFGDMQYKAVHLLENDPGVLEKVRSGIRYMIVDEFQDTDYLQLQLIKLLAPEGAVTVVGDDDQSIYRFRGAYLTNVAEFTEFYGREVTRPERIVLRRNYRCTGNIQRAATALIDRNPERQEKEMETEKGEGAPMVVTGYATEWDQARGMVNRIRELHDDGVPYEDMAILVRKRVHSVPIQEVMDKNRVPYEMIGGREFFREPIIKAVVSYLRAISDPLAHQPDLAAVMRRPAHGITVTDLHRLNTRARDDDITLWEALDRPDDPGGDRAPLDRFREEMERLIRIRGEADLATTVRSVLFGRDLFREEISGPDRGNVTLLNGFLRITGEFLSIHPDADLEDFLDYLSALTELGHQEIEGDVVPGRVNLMTVHGSKGKEFPYVFIPCLDRGHFPSRYQSYKIDIPEGLSFGIRSDYSDREIHGHEERRLLYVAMTRAQEELRMGHCRRYSQRKTESEPSVFLGDITGLEGCETREVEEVEDAGDGPGPVSVDGALRHRLVQSVGRRDWSGALGAIAALAKSNGADPSDLDLPGDVDVDRLLARLERERREPEVEHAERASYSPSKLGTYEDCPRKYYFQYVLSIPDEVRTYFELGTVVHAVIEALSRRMRDGEEVTQDDALTLLDAHWRSSVYTSTGQERQDREEAEGMLIDFLARQEGRDGEIVDIERGVELDVEGRRIRGKVDRIDRVGDQLEIIDYKTSRYKTSRPQLRRDFQMVLYWLGTERALDMPVVRVGHWYLRMDREWMVEISEDERNEVLERAKDVMASIERGEFGATPGYRACRYCGYRALCDEGE